MTDKRLADLFEFIQNTWGPGQTTWMSSESVFDTWRIALRPYDDMLVEKAVAELYRTQREQRWPVNLAEITSTCERLKRHYVSMGVQF